MTNDKELVKKAQLGDKSAFNKLVTKYEPRVKRLVVQYTNNSNEAEDIIQETFIKAYNAIENFRNESSLYTWIYRIAINTSKNYFISQNRRIKNGITENEDLDNLISETFETPEEILSRNELEKIVFNTINELPSTLEKTIKLRELEGLSYEEIANKMKCPIGTVRSRIFRAREIIYEKIENYM